MLLDVWVLVQIWVDFMLGKLNYELLCYKMRLAQQAKRKGYISHISCSSRRRIIMQDQHFNKSWRPMHQTINK